MMLGQPESEHNRFRVGMLFLAIGILLLLWAWGSWLFRSSVPVEPTPVIQGSSWTLLPAASAAEGDANQSEARRGLARVSLIMMTFLLILIAVCFGGYAVIIAARRYRALMERKQATPTRCDDVWSMHRLPDDE